MHDCDFELSAIEEQGFLAQRSSPHFDRQSVEGTSSSNLDSELTGLWLTSVQERDPRGLGRFADETELLRRAGVIAVNGELTRAGLLTLGSYPQQWLPRFVIQIAADRKPEDSLEIRARNQQTITGPIPRMLDETMSWAVRNFDSIIVNNPDGIVRDAVEYPLDAFRELVANALVHRDLNDWSSGLATEIRLRHNKLIIDNPGGLYGISVDRLGREAVTSPRNSLLVSLCQYARSQPTKTRVIEALATGIPIVNAALKIAGLPPARFVDTGIRFTVTLRQWEKNGTQAASLNPTEIRIYDALKAELTVTQLEAILGLKGPNIRKALRTLRRFGLIQLIGGKGKKTTYKRTSESE